MDIYHLFFEREFPDREDVSISIGFFSKKTDALKVIEDLRIKPGFKEYPDGFVIDRITLGHFGFRDGFESIIGPPPKDKDGEVFDLPI